MPQRLIATRRVGVVIRMPLQLVQHQVRHDVVAIPGVARLTALATTTRLNLSQQAVVLQVVHDLKQSSAVHGLGQQEEERVGSEPNREGAEQGNGHRPSLQVLIPRRPDRFPAAFQAELFERPGRAQAANHRARQELPEGFAHLRAGRIVRRRHVLVVPLVMLNEEMTVCHRRQGDLGQPALQRAGLVPELVSRIDADPIDHPNGDHEAQHFPPNQIASHSQPRAEDCRRVLAGDIGVDDDAVVAILNQSRDRRLRGVHGISADQVIKQRHHGIEHEEKCPVQGPDLELVRCK